ncbi:hypothetical protein B0J14DRAFT_608189 [Halenospora varia]|nr:hypothetical protein B0J14DRAFT_608189 [Halenospora varia]
MASTKESLSPVLVLGGNGIVGYHIITLLLQQDQGPIYSLSRNPTSNTSNHIAGVTYIRGDISDSARLTQVLKEVQPKVIFQTAAPRASDTSITASQFHDGIIKGTKNVIDCAMKAPSVKALIYTSTAGVLRGYEYFNADETYPLWSETDNVIPYMKLKAEADTMVREANTSLGENGQGLLTVALRPTNIYGEHDTQWVPSNLELLKAGQNRVQIGGGRNGCEPAWAGNVAMAHVLAARKLLEETEKEVDGDMRVAGEAFIVHDGKSIPLWEMIRMTRRAAGDTTQEKDLIVIPAWVAWTLVAIIEWMYWIFTLGTKQPPLSLSRLYISVTVCNVTSSIEKARKRLGYGPVVDQEGNMRRAVEWELGNNAEKWKDLPYFKKR